MVSLVGARISLNYISSIFKCQREPGGKLLVVDSIAYPTVPVSFLEKLANGITSLSYPQSQDEAMSRLVAAFGLGEAAVHYFGYLQK